MDIENIFTYHKPFGTQPERYEHLRAEAKTLARAIMLHCPDSREKSLALTNLQQAIMWAFVENTADAIKERIDYLNRLNIYANDRFFVVWWWDGDGNLTVGELDHGAIVRAANNSDCKKDYTWIWIR